MSQPSETIPQVEIHPSRIIESGTPNLSDKPNVQTVQNTQETNVKKESVVVETLESEKITAPSTSASDERKSGLDLLAVATTMAPSSDSSLVLSDHHLDDSDDSHDDIRCVNCNTSRTPLWRRDEQGNPICNACGLWQKLHKTPRPLHMCKDDIVRRRRRSIAIARPKQEKPRPTYNPYPTPQFQSQYPSPQFQSQPLVYNLDQRTRSVSADVYHSRERYATGYVQGYNGYYYPTNMFPNMMPTVQMQQMQQQMQQQMPMSTMSPQMASLTQMPQMSQMMRTMPIMPTTQSYYNQMSTQSQMQPVYHEGYHYQYPVQPNPVYEKKHYERRPSLTHNPTLVSPTSMLSDRTRTMTSSSVASVASTVNQEFEKLHATSPLHVQPVVNVQEKPVIHVQETVVLNASHN